MTIFFVFLDGVGLGEDQPEKNPFSAIQLPFLSSVLDGRPLLQAEAPVHTTKASLLSLDASMGVDGFPQSATGQAVLLTGINIPLAIGYHYGPKPDDNTARFLSAGGLFGELIKYGKKVTFLNAYPQRYFDTIKSGKHLYSSFPLAATNSGMVLLNSQDLMAGNAVSADITGLGWKEFLNVENMEVKTPFKVGTELAKRSAKYDLVFFEYWLTDYAGHRQDMMEARKILLQIDEFLQGISQSMRSDDLILVTSDHGNMEDLATRRHTMNHVPLILIGNESVRGSFATARSICDVAPSVKKFLGLID